MKMSMIMENKFKYFWVPLAMTQIVISIILASTVFFLIKPVQIFLVTIFDILKKNFRVLED